MDTIKILDLAFVVYSLDGVDTVGYCCLGRGEIVRGAEPEGTS